MPRVPWSGPVAVGRNVPIAPLRPVAVRTAHAPLPCAPPVRLGGIGRDVPIAPPRYIARGGSPPRCLAWQVAHAESFAGASPCVPHSRAGRGVRSPTRGTAVGPNHYTRVLPGPRWGHRALRHYTRKIRTHYPHTARAPWSCPSPPRSITPAHYSGGAMLGRRASRLAPYRHYSRDIRTRRCAPLPCAPVSVRSQPHVLEQGKNTQWQGHRKRTVSRTTAKGGKIRRPLLLGKHRNPCRRTNGERRRRQT